MQRIANGNFFELEEDGQEKKKKSRGVRSHIAWTPKELTTEQYQDVFVLILHKHLNKNT